MLRIVKTNLRNARQTKAYQDYLTRQLVWITGQITRLQEELIRVRREISDPKEHEFYCDDCGRGYSDIGAKDRALDCCDFDIKHP